MTRKCNYSFNDSWLILNISLKSHNSVSSLEGDTMNRRDEEFVRKCVLYLVNGVNRYTQCLREYYLPTKGSNINELNSNPAIVIEQSDWCSRRASCAAEANYPAWFIVKKYKMWARTSAITASEESQSNPLCHLLASTSNAYGRADWEIFRFLIF